MRVEPAAADTLKSRRATDSTRVRQEAGARAGGVGVEAEWAEVGEECGASESSEFSALSAAAAAGAETGNWSSKRMAASLCAAISLRCRVSSIRFLVAEVRCGVEEESAGAGADPTVRRPCFGRAGLALDAASFAFRSCLHGSCALACAAFCRLIIRCASTACHLSERQVCSDTGCEWT